MIILIVCVWLVCSITCGRIFYLYTQGRFQNIAYKDRREDLGFAILFGMLYGFLGPVGILLALLQTGFAKYGFWIRRRHESIQSRLVLYN